jgi:asparagine synthetase B (glutamine-hydrolysing)
VSGWIAWRDAPPGGLARVSRVLGARGPHGWDVAQVGRWSLGLSAGEPGEPSGRVAAAGAWGAVASGGATNLRRLRAEASARGTIVPAHTPQAVAAIAAALGAGRVADHVRGALAFAAAGGDGALHVARDPVGVREVLVAGEAGGAANDARALLAAGMGGGVDEAALEAWADRGTWSSGATPWRGIRRVPAGGAAVWDGDGVRVRPGPDAPMQPAGLGGDAERWARSLGWALALAIRAELDALGGAGRRPRVAFALGGAASATVLAAAAARGGCDLVAVVRDTGDAPQRAWAARVASSCGARLVVVEGDAARDVEDAARAVEWPLSPDGLVWWRLVRAAGDAGAEAFVTGLGARASLELGVDDALSAARGRLSGGGAALRAQPSRRRAALAAEILPLLERLAGDEGMAVAHPWCDASFVALAATVPVLHLLRRPGDTLRARVARYAAGTELPVAPVETVGLPGVAAGPHAVAWRQAAVDRWRAAGHGG